MFNAGPPENPPKVVGTTFVADDGEGNASVMKNAKPVFHRRGGDFHDEDDESYEDELEGIRRQEGITKLYTFTNFIFFVSSLLYTAMACMIMDYYFYYKDVPQEVLNADDDASWWNYFVNCTDDQFFPENVTNADDDYTWMVWYNESAFMEDDTYFWQPKIADENADGAESYVSKYMILYFFAAFGFLVTGIIEVILARKAFWYRMLYWGMVIAAAFGMASAVLTNKDPRWSAICSFISVHIWALEAILILVQRCRGQMASDADEYDDDDGFGGLTVEQWFYIADISFVIGTVGDCVLSYYYIFQIDNWKLGIAAIVFALFWLICAIVYLLVSIYDLRQFKLYREEIEEERKLEMGGGTKPTANKAIPEVTSIYSPTKENVGVTSITTKGESQASSASDFN